MTEPEWSQYFSRYKSMGIFPDAQGQLTFLDPSRILPKFDPIQAVMVVLVTCKNEVDPIKDEGARVVTSLLKPYQSSVAMETRVLIRYGPKPYAANPLLQ